VQKQLQPDGSLSLACGIEFFLHTDMLLDDAGLTPGLTSEAELKEICSKEMGSLLSTGENSDCILVVGSGMAYLKSEWVTS
jgi:hypothetical protein